MHNQIIILAGDYREGRRFAGDVGLGMGAIVPVDAARVRGLRPNIIIELASYATRPDRFAMEAILQRSYAKIGGDPIEMYIEDPSEYRPKPAVEAQALPGPLEVHGQTTVEEQLAIAEVDRLRRVAAFDTTAIATSEEQAAADAPKTPAAVLPPKPGYKPRSRAKGKR